MSFKDVLNSLSDDPNLRVLKEEESIKLKQTLLDNYLVIQEYCQKNNLSVMMVGGSALGAIRHKGFIPWDDDMDIAMPREDYNLLCKNFERDLGDRFALDAPNTNRKSSNRFPKILIKNTRLVELGMQDDDENACIKIDLFVIENTPQNVFVRVLHGFICSLMMYIAGQVDTYEKQDERFQKFMCKSEEGKRVYNRRKRIGKLFSFLPAYKWFNIVDKVCQYKRETGVKGIPTGRKHYFGEILPSRSFLPVSTADFEGHKVSVPGNPDSYLSNLFGDYMTIPKKSEREKHFIYDIKFKD